MKIRNILALTDLSECSINGLALADSLARRFHARVHGGYVFTEKGRLGHLEAATRENAEKISEWYRRDQETHLDVLFKKYIDPLRLAGVDTVERHSAREGIGELIKRAQPDLICMSTHGRVGLHHVLLGSVAEHTLRTAGVPVVVTKGRPFPRIDEPIRVLVGVDLLEEPERVIRPVAELLSPQDELLLAHVVEPAYLTLPAYGPEYAENLPDAHNLMEAADLKLRSVRLPGEAPRISVHITAGKGGPGMIELTTTHKPDLVVVHTHGRHGFDRLMLGSVAEYLARKCESPVLVLPREIDS